MAALLLFTTRDFTHPSELNPSHSGSAEQMAFSCATVAEYTTNMSWRKEEWEREEEGGREER